MGLNWSGAIKGVADSVNQTSQLMIQNEIQKMREERMQGYRRAEVADQRSYDGILRKEANAREDMKIEGSQAHQASMQNDRQEHATKLSDRANSQRSKLQERGAEIDQDARKSSQLHALNISGFEHDNRTELQERKASLERELQEIKAAQKNGPESRTARTQYQLSGEARKVAESFVGQGQESTMLAGMIEMVAGDIPRANINQLGELINGNEPQAIAAYLESTKIPRDKAIDIMKRLGFRVAQQQAR